MAFAGELRRLRTAFGVLKKYVSELIVQGRLSRGRKGSEASFRPFKNTKDDEMHAGLQREVAADEAVETGSSW